MLSPPESFDVTPDDFVWSLKMTLSLMTERILLPHLFQLRLPCGLVLHEYSRAGKQLKLADYHVFSNTNLHLYLVPGAPKPSEVPKGDARAWGVGVGTGTPRVPPQASGGMGGGVRGPPLAQVRGPGRGAPAGEERERS